MKNNKINLVDYRAVILGSGNFGQLLARELKKNVGDVIVGNRSGKVKGHEAFSYDKFPVLKENDFAIVATRQEIVTRVTNILSEQGIPTIITTSNITKKDLKRQENTRLLISNCGIALVELQGIFESISCLKGLKLVVLESHPSGKPDKSGTAMSFREMWIAKKGECHFDDDEEYNPNKGVNNFRDIMSYRGKKSMELGIEKKYLMAHSYHEFIIEGSKSKQKEIDEIFVKLKAWKNKYRNKDTSLLIDLERTEKGINIIHRVNGRNIYVAGLLEILSWFLQQKQGKLYSVSDFLDKKQKILETRNT